METSFDIPEAGGTDSFGELCQLFNMIGLGMLDPTKLSFNVSRRRTMPDAPANPYDTLVYPGFALTQAHPDRLATLATLFGMTSIDVSHCRVLELGCGDGVNLIGVALELPEAHCVGVDLAAAGIKKGQSLVHKLGLKNITLHQCDMMDIGRDFGQFDFIIAHGVYSWVLRVFVIKSSQSVRKISLRTGSRMSVITLTLAVTCVT